MTDHPNDLHAFLTAFAVFVAVVAYARLRYSDLATRTPIGSWHFKGLPWQWGRDSLLISRSGPSEDFCSAFAATLKANTRVIMPAGDGCYPDHLPSQKRERWFQALKQATANKAKIDLLITSPNGRAPEIWKDLEKASQGYFTVRYVDRSSLSSDLETEVERLDTFHPVLFYKFADDPASGAPVVPLGMWIEKYHPLGTADAFDIEVVGSRSVLKDERFHIYYDLLSEIIQSHTAVLGSEVERNDLPTAAAA